MEGADWVAATARLREHVHAWTGNEAQLVELTQASFASLVKDHNPLITAVRADGVTLTPGSRTVLRGAT